MNDDNHSGYASLVSAIVSAIGLAGLLHPTWVWLGVLSAHKDDLANVLPPVLVGFGTIGAMVSKPNSWLHGVVMDVRFWLASFFRRKPTP